MDRRQFLGGGAALGLAAATGDVAGSRLRTPQGPRSDRPHGGSTAALVTPVIWHAAPATTTIALTFDDGPSPLWTPMVLDLLDKHGVPATFYVVGERAARRTDLLRRAAAAGHEIGNHTWNHLDLVQATPAAVREQLQRTSELIRQVTGTSPATMRPPWGHIDPVGLLAAAQLSCSVVLWSELIRATSPQGDLAQTLRDVRPGSVLLSHDGGPTPTLEQIHAVDTLVGTLLERGYTFTTVSALVHDLVHGGPAAEQTADVTVVALPIPPQTS